VYIRVRVGNGWDYREGGKVFFTQRRKEYKYILPQRRGDAEEYIPAPPRLCGNKRIKGRCFFVSGSGSFRPELKTYYFIPHYTRYPLNETFHK